MNSPAPHDPLVPFSKVGSLVRQLAHDVRNGLNAMDLEAAFVSELVTDGEASAELKKLRRMIGDVAENLQGLSQRFVTPEPYRVELSGEDFVAGLRRRIDQKFKEDAGAFTWSSEIGGDVVEVDFEMMNDALSEVFQNALQFRGSDAPIAFRASKSAREICFELSEQSALAGSDPSGWGREPLITTRRGGYGLGLFHARRIVEAHGGQLNLTHEADRLVTRISIPAQA